MFACYSKQLIEANKFRIYIVSEFGDLYEIEYLLTGSLVAHFNLRYINSVKTLHSIVYVGEADNSEIRIGENETAKIKYESSILLLLGLERFSVSLYFVFPSKTV